MNLKIDLAKKDRCDGCPCINRDSESGSGCNMGYWDNSWDWDGTNPRGEYDEYFNYIRPTKCIEENGE